MKTFLKNKWIKIGFVFIIAALAFTLAISFTNKNTKIVDATEPKTLSIAYNNLAFQDNVYIVYAVASENIEDKQNIKVLVWENPQEEYTLDTQDYTLSYYRTMNINGVPHSVFILNSLSAKQMTEEVYAIAYYDGIYSAPNKYSILQYAKNKITSTDNDNLRNLLTNMLAYGASAQIYYNYNTDKLATDTYYNVTVANGKLSDGFIKGLYKEGTEITVTANAPAAGYTFKQWTDGTTALGTNATLTYALDKNITLTAEYAEENQSEATADEYFTFTLLSDDTYEIKAKDVNDMPANVVLPSTYNDKSVTSIGYEAFRGCSSLTSITIGGSVTSIGNYAFRYCSSLTSLTVDENNANYKSIDGNLYNKDGTTLIQYAIGKAATEFTIPDSVISIGSYAFENCSNLTNIILCNSISNMGRAAFSNCIGLTSIGIPNNITRIEDYAFYNCSGLTSVTFGENSQLTSIGDWAFELCSNLTIIEIPDSVTSIGDGAFHNCSGLISVEIPDSVTSIGSFAFGSCNGLTGVTFTASSQLTSIGNWAFEFCSNLTSITITDKVMSIGSGAFKECSSLNNVYYVGTVESWDNITIGNENNYLNDASRYYYSENYPENFVANTYWHYVDGVPNVWEYTATPDEYFTFTLLSNDTYEIKAKNSNNMPAEVILPSTYDNKPVTSIGNYAFFLCSSLTSITIPDSVTRIEREAFWYCSSLTSVTIGNSDTSIGERAFGYCSSLTSITIPDSVTSIGERAFGYCSSLTSINVGENNAYYKSIDGNLYSKDGTVLIQYAIGKTATEFTIPDSVTSIGSEAFFYCYTLTSITIPDSVTSIGYSAFSGCSSLEVVTFGANSKLEVIGYYSFYNCSSLSTITIPDSVTSIGSYSFAGDYSRPMNLTSINIGKGVTSIGDYAFYYCSSLYYVINKSDLELTFGSIDNGYIAFYAKAIENKEGNVTYRDNPIFIENDFMFEYISKEYCLIAYTGNEETVTLPLTYNGNSYTIYGMRGVKNVIIPYGFTSIGNYAFYNCRKLTSITIPNSVTSIGNNAFAYCSSLTSITIPDGVTSIGDYAFYNCRKLTSITIPDGVTSIGEGVFEGCSSLTSITFGANSKLTSIGDSAFEGCSSLTSITIPNSVTRIRYEAFYDCSSLTSITFEGTIERWNAISKGYNWKYNVPATVVHCTDGDVEI